MGIQSDNFDPQQCVIKDEEGADLLFAKVNWLVMPK